MIFHSASRNYVPIFILLPLIKQNNRSNWQYSADSGLKYLNGECIITKTIFT